MPLDPYGLYTGQVPGPRPAAPVYPPVPPEEEAGLLSRIGGSMLSGVGALGRFLDATFGGRAVRGLLGGHPRELLSPLPFSDSLGLTDPNEFTTGRQLLEKAGVVEGPEPGLDWGDAAGFGVDLLTNPLTYIQPLGALTPAGRLFNRIAPGKMPRGLGGQIRGADYAAEQVAQLPPVASGALPAELAVPARASLIPAEVSRAARAEGLELLPRQTRLALHEADVLPPTPLDLPPGAGPSQPVPLAPGQPPPFSLEEATRRLQAGQYPPAAQYVGMGTAKGYRTLDVTPAAGIDPPMIASSRHAFLDAPTTASQGTPLASALGVKIPFGPQFNFGTGPWAQAWGDTLDRFGGWLGQTALVRGLAQRLHPASMSRTQAETQQLAREVYRPTQRELMPGVLGEGYDVNAALRPGLEALPAAEARRLASLAAENQPVPLNAPAYEADLAARDPSLYAHLGSEGRLPNAMPPAVFQDLQAAGQRAGDYQRSLLDLEHAAGIPGEPLADYTLHQRVQVPGGGGTGAGGKSLSARHLSQVPRQDLFRDFASKEQLNDLVKLRDASGRPLLTGPERLLPADQAADLVGQSLYGAGGPQGAAQAKQAQDLADYLGTLDPEHAVRGYFESDPALGVLGRGTRSANARAGAATNLEALRRHALPLAELGDQPLETVPQFLERAGLTHVDPATGENVGRHLAAQRLGLEDAAQLGNYGVPTRISDDLLGLSKNPTAGVTGYDRALNLYRSLLYGLWPASQARNRLWGIVSNWRAGAGPLEQLRARSDTSKLLRGTGEVEPLPGMPPGLSPAEAREAIKREVYSQNAALTQATRQRYQVENSPTADALNRLGQSLPPEASGGGELEAVGNWFKGLRAAPEQTAGQAYGKFWNTPGVVDDVGPGGGFTPARQMRLLGQTTEDMNRLGLYLPLRRQGYSPEAAAEATNRYHFLYNDLTDWERNVGRRLFLFPTFSARNLPLLGQELATEPAKLNALIQASAGGLRGRDEFVPPYLAESTAIPLGEAGSEGTQRYLSGFGFGYEDEPVRAVGSLLGGQPARALGQAGSLLNPLAKLAIETATGTQLHTGRRLEDLKAGPSAQALSAFDEDRAGVVAQLLANSPLARAAGTLDQAVDERKGLLPKAANVLTGLRFTDVDLARQKEIAARQLVESALRGKAGFGDYERLYVKPEKVGNLSPDEFALMSLYTQLEKQAVAAAKARKAAQGLPPGLPAP